MRTACVAVSIVAENGTGIGPTTEPVTASPSPVHRASYRTTAVVDTVSGRVPVSPARATVAVDAT
jgi:hypothetical protein